MRTITDQYIGASTILSPMEREAVVESLAILEIPIDEYFVIGGANLVLRQIIQRTQDIDILVSDGMFNELQVEEGAHLKEPPLSAQIRGATNRTIWVTNTSLPVPVSATTALGDGYYPISFGSHREHTELIDGIPCLTLDEVIASKEALQRPKDVIHLRAVASYLGIPLELPPATIAYPVFQS